MLFLVKSVKVFHYLKYSKSEFSVDISLLWQSIRLIRVLKVINMLSIFLR